MTHYGEEEKNGEVQAAVCSGEEVVVEGPDKAEPRVRTTSPTNSGGQTSRSGEDRTRQRSPRRHAVTKLPSNPDRARSPKRGTDKSPTRGQDLSPKRNPKIAGLSPKSKPKGDAEAAKITERSESPPLSPMRAKEAFMDTALRVPARGSSPEPSRSSRSPVVSGDEKEKRRQNSPKRNQSTEKIERGARTHTSPPNRTRSPQKERSRSPKRTDTGEHSATSSKSKSAKKPVVDAPPQELREPSLVLVTDPDLVLVTDPEEAETDDESTTKDPRYISPKGNTTHLQLQLDPSAIRMKKDLPIFSLLDESKHLLDGTDKQLSEPSVAFEPPLAADAESPPSAQATMAEIKDTKEFQPWGSLSDNLDDDDGVGHYNHNSAPSPVKSSLSPLRVRKAMKALKYNKPSIAKTVGSIATGFQQTLRARANKRHQQMNDDDDLAELID